MEICIFSNFGQNRSRYMFLKMERKIIALNFFVLKFAIFIQKLKKKNKKKKLLEMFTNVFPLCW